MAGKKQISVIPQQIIETKIYLIRGRKVMIDRDLAELYGVETKFLKRAVKRNIARFPDDFMFELTREELENWRCQIGISNLDNGYAKMGLRRPPYAFTELGVAMLSSVLNSERAIQVNIQIMRTFTKIREMLFSYKDIVDKLDEIEDRLSFHDEQILTVLDAIKLLMTPPAKPTPQIGFKPE